MVSNYLAVEENAINIYYQVCIVDVTLVVIDALDLWVDNDKVKVVMLVANRVVKEIPIENGQLEQVVWLVCNEVLTDLSVAGGLN